MGLDYTTTGLIFQKMAESLGSLAGTCLIQVAGARLLAESRNKGMIEKYLSEVCAGNLIHLFVYHRAQRRVQSRRYNNDDEERRDRLSC